MKQLKLLMVKIFVYNFVVNRKEEGGFMHIIDGKAISTHIKTQTKEEIEQYVAKGYRSPKLAVVLVGDDQASQVYVRNKEKACLNVGIENSLICKPATISEDELISIVDSLNQDDTIDGILVQLPLPKHISEKRIIESILPSKDVDGFHPTNIAALFLGYHGYYPCTPVGVMHLVDTVCPDLAGKEVVIVGRSNNVGKPLALLALQRNATVTICHSKTKNLADVCRKADVLICAVGKAHMITSDYVKEGAIVIDVGINRNQDGKICGDVDFESVKEQVSFITPVPGGVGPMTIAILMRNTLDTYKNNYVRWEKK